MKLENSNATVTGRVVEEHEVMMPESEELSLDELEAVTGGALFNCSWD